MKRLQQLKNQVIKPSQSANQHGEGRSVNKLEWFKEQGWGYNDTEFKLYPDGFVRISGSRYSLCGRKLPNFMKWAESKMGVDKSLATPPKEKPEVNQPQFLNHSFLDELHKSNIEVLMDERERIFHSHGHTAQELFALRHGKLEKCVDAVVYVISHEEVEVLVKLAIKHNVVIIPYGGGTNVTQALLVNPNEKRMVISVDMQKMNHIKWIDRTNLLACIEAGVIGQDLERELEKYGLMVGHEPDSSEFSSVGGWVATRASGMKKNRYGNFEDIMINVKVVTPIGTFEKGQNCPRVSSGPDINHFFLGSEGNLGIVTEVIIKLRLLPEIKEFDSIVFPDIEEGKHLVILFNKGIKFMQELSLSKIWPASCRLVDNSQFQFGHVIKPEESSVAKALIDKAKSFYVTKIKKYDPEQLTVCTLVFEGSKQEVTLQQKNVKQLASKYQGMMAGAENGKRGFFLTYQIAYLRDFGLNYSVIAESFETSCPWTSVSNLISSVKTRIYKECESQGVKKPPLVSARVTHLYDTGAAVYIYLGFVYDGIKNPVEAYEAVEWAAREEIMKCGGCISHHHGVGKIRKGFMEQSIGETGISILQKLKREIDPSNIFATKNLYYDEEEKKNAKTHQH